MVVQIARTATNAIKAIIHYCRHPDLLYRSCHSSRRRLQSSAARTKQANNEQCTLQRAGSFPLKSALHMGRSGPRLIQSSLEPDESFLQTASRSIQPFMRSSTVCPTPIDMCSMASHVRTYCMRNTKKNTNIVVGLFGRIVQFL